MHLSDLGRNLKEAGSYREYARNWLQEPNHLRRLDWMLNFMATNAAQGVGIENAWNRIKILHPTIHVEFLESFRLQMIEKLVDNGYLVFDGSLCTVTLEGVLFNDNGGYLGESSRRLFDDRIKTRREILLMVGSWIAGIGAVGLCVIEIWKMYHV